MLQNNQNEQLTKIANRITPRLDRYESVIFLILLVALLLRISTNLPTGIVIALALISLSTLYFFSAFSFKEDEHTGGMGLFIEKLTAISASVGVIGMLFTLQRWPGADKMLLIGCGTLLISLPIIYYYKSRIPELKIFTSRMVIRTIVIAALGLALNFTPKETLKNIGLIKELKVEKVE
jgi:hypothetical protein